MRVAVLVGTREADRKSQTAKQRESDAQRKSGESSGRPRSQRSVSIFSPQNLRFLLLSLLRSTRVWAFDAPVCRSTINFAEALLAVYRVSDRLLSVPISSIYQSPGRSTDSGTCSPLSPFFSFCRLFCLLTCSTPRSMPPRCLTLHGRNGSLPKENTAVHCRNKQR